MRVPTTLADFLFLRKKIPASHRTRGGTPAVSLALGANREGKERVEGKTNRVPSSRIGSALVCVRRNVQHSKLKLPKSTRFALITAVMVAVPTGGPTGCLVSPPPLFSLCVCVLHCVVVLFILDVRLVDVPAGVTQEEGHTGFLIYLPSAVLALILLARRIPPFLSLSSTVKSNFCVLTI